MNKYDDQLVSIKWIYSNDYIIYKIYNFYI